MNLPLQMGTNTTPKYNQKPYKNLIASRCFTLLNNFQVILRGSSSEYKIASEKFAFSHCICPEITM